MRDKHYYCGSFRKLERDTISYGRCKLESLNDLDASVQLVAALYSSPATGRCHISSPSLSPLSSYQTNYDERHAPGDPVTGLKYTACL